MKFIYVLSVFTCGLVLMCFGQQKPSYVLEEFSIDGDVITSVTVGKKANWNRVCEAYTPNKWGGITRLGVPKYGLSSATNQTRTLRLTLDKYLKSSPGSAGAVPFGVAPPSKWGQFWECDDYPEVTFAVRVSPGPGESEEMAHNAYLTLVEAMMAAFPPKVKEQ